MKLLEISYSFYLAEPFDYRGGLVNPNKAAEPGLLYDTCIDDYIHYLCAVSYNNLSISCLVGQATRCPNTKPSVLYVNLPSIIIPNLRESITLTQTVTNGGPQNSTYKVIIENPFGIVVTAIPNILIFNSTTRMNSFAVTISTSHKVNTVGIYAIKPVKVNIIRHKLK
ncbi:hypothetical protein ACOSP7_016715 [Xanthoceras sorbifolium]